MQAIDTIGGRQAITTSQTEALLRKIRQASETEGIEVVSDDSISLKCPLSFARIDVPCRGSRCAHAQCFDLRSFLAFAERFHRWSCPVCEDVVSFDELRVDELTVRALRLQPEADRFTMGAKGITFSSACESSPRAISANTPDTTKKVGSQVDVAAQLEEPALLEKFDEAAMSSAEGGAASGIGQLQESGVWEHCEEAEAAFSLPRCPSPARSKRLQRRQSVRRSICDMNDDSPEDTGEEFAENTDEAAPSSSTGSGQRSSVKGLACAHRSAASEPAESGSAATKNGYTARRLRARASIKYLESSGGSSNSASEDDS